MSVFTTDSSRQGSIRTRYALARERIIRVLPRVERNLFWKTCYTLFTGLEQTYRAPSLFICFTTSLTSPLIALSTLDGLNVSVMPVQTSCPSSEEIT